MSNHHKFTNSSSLEHCDYDDKTNTLKLKFCSSPKEHEYPDCPKSIYEGFKAAESPGKYYHQHVRNKIAVK